MLYSTRTMLEWFLIAASLQVVFAHVYAARMRLSQSGVACLHFPCTMVALVLLFVFVIGHGTPVAQFAAGSEEAEARWSSWFHLWPMLLVATGLATVLYGIAAIAAAVMRKWHWLVLLLVGAAMLAFAFMTVGALHPTA